ncbi:MAG TPA: DUF4835 family protein [Candidatus Kapabacteria bacterium]|nr:DUF4835 family protein [Candidatus Kapabacteria bacterium]
MVQLMKLICILGVVAVLSLGSALRAQELNCVVTVNLQTLSDQERQVWETFKPDVEAYLNTYSWTTNFSGQKIQCSMAFNITGSNGSEYNVQLFVQSSRLYAGSKQATTMARFLDNNVTFSYTRGMPLQHGNNYRELESVLDYYADIIVGLDQDSYTSQGGTLAFQNAQQVALIANSSQGNGWDRAITISGTFSRVGYIEDILNANTRVLRDMWLNYHQNVIDQITTNEDVARAGLATIVDTLITLKRQSSDIDRSVYYKIVFNAKYTEFADFARWFKENADLYFRKLKYIDPSHISFYEDALSKMN